MFGIAGAAIRSITVFIDSVAVPIFGTRVDVWILVVAVAWWKVAGSTRGVGPGAGAYVFSRYVPILVQIVVIIPLTVRVNTVVWSVGRAWIYGRIAVIAVHFIRPGVAVFVHSVVNGESACVLLICGPGWADTKQYGEERYLEEDSFHD